jgi:uncharacterized SAM-binding protein YcdF (DUF218 family)
VATLLVQLLFSITGFLFFLVAGILWLRARPSSRAARRYVAIVTIVYLLFSIYGANYAVGRLLMVGFHPFSQSDVPQGRTALIVLGSGSFTARNWGTDKYSVLDPPAAMRVLEAVRVFRIANPEWVISSGGLVNENAGPLSSGAVTMRDALIDLGVPASRILLEDRSHNTRDEAVIVAPMLRTLGADHVILVTSELHMRRSVGAFRAVGVEVIPAIARGIFTTLPWYLWIIPSDAGIIEGSFLAHELVGITYYALRGWYK